MLGAPTGGALASSEPAAVLRLAEGASPSSGGGPRAPAEPQGAEEEGEEEEEGPEEEAQAGARRRRRQLPLPPNVLGPPEEYDFPHVGDDAWGHVYHFTTHARVDKERFLAAVKETYLAVMPRGSPCRAGPKHAVVAREFGRRRPRRPHLHLAGEFPARHRWKRVRDHLARVHGIHVSLGNDPGRQAPFPLRESEARGVSDLARGGPGRRSNRTH